MYTDFYSLKEKPFNLTPSPQFLYLGESHKEALALLTYGVVERKGFILLTGEVGTGKTTIIHALLANLDKSVKYVHISNPLLSPKDFMNYLAVSAFKKKVRFKSKAYFLFEFEAYLKEFLHHQKAFILIIDEAQTLSFELLEEIRLLSNMESAYENLINILLVGQPELNEKLSDPRCKALLQRISTRHHILPLNLEDSREYMETRLKVAGARDANEIFSKGAVKAINKYSQGYPRVINILADNCLLLGYSKGKRRITSSIVQKSHEDMKLYVSIPKVTQETPGPTEKEKEPFGMKKNTGRHWKWAAALILIVIGVVFGMSQKARSLLGQLSDFTTIIQNTPPIGRITLRKTSEKVSKPIKRQVSEGVVQQIELKKEESVEAQAVENLEEPIETAMEVESEIKGIKPQGKPQPLFYSETPLQEDRVLKTPIKLEETKKEEIHQSTEETPLSLKSLIIREEDTLSKLAIKLYGTFDNNVLNLMHKYNPEIKDINQIRVGQKLILPLTSLPYQGPVYTVHIASFQPFKYAKDLFLKMVKEGYEGYIISTDDTLKRKVFRVTLGTFRSHKEAKDFASMILEKNISDYAEAIQLEVS